MDNAVSSSVASVQEFRRQLKEFSETFGMNGTPRDQWTKEQNEYFKIYESRLRSRIDQRRERILLALIASGQIPADEFDSVTIERIADFERVLDSFD